MYSEFLQHKQIRGVSPLVPILIILLASCTVKERREHCPCLLSLQVEGGGPRPLRLWTSSALGSQAFTLHGAADTTLTLAVAKSGALVLAGAACPPAFPEEGVRIPEGEDCPPVWLFSSRVDTGCDGLTVPVRLHKHYCTLSLSLRGAAGDGEPFWTEVRGEVCGLSSGGRPLPGRFHCRLEPGGSVRLPRQAPSDALWLDVCLKDGAVRSFALGTLLLQSDYDWSAEDLEDIPLSLELSVTALRLRFPSWEDRTIPVEIKI